MGVNKSQNSRVLLMREGTEVKEGRQSLLDILVGMQQIFLEAELVNS